MVAFIAFDLLAEPSADWRTKPFSARRQRLEAVMVDTVPPLHLTASTTDPDLAQLWWETWPSLGIEGLVVKGLAQPYRERRRDWLKVRYRDTAEAIVGAVVGALDEPERLVLGAHDARGGCGSSAQLVR